MSKKSSSKTDIPKEKKPEEKKDAIPEVKHIAVDKSVKIEESAEGVLQRLIYFCMKRGINMMKHLQRYDLTKQGKLNKSDFAKAIDELKLGLIDSDIVKLLDWMKIQENYVEIAYFVDLMIKTDPTYAPFAKDQGKNTYYYIIILF